MNTRRFLSSNSAPPGSPAGRPPSHGPRHSAILAGLLTLLASLALAPAPALAAGADGLEMILDGQILRRLPHPSTGLLAITQHVGKVGLDMQDGVANYVGRAGISSFANDRGSFAITAATSPDTVTNRASVRWQREFTKLPDNVPFHYTVNPSRLRIVAANGDLTNHFLASWQLIVRINGETNMYCERVIEGFARPFGPTAFGLTTNTGPIETAHWDLGNSLHEALYTTLRYPGQLDLTNIAAGQRFTVEYEMNTRLVDTLGRETVTEVYIGDPLSYGSGFQTSYGAFGELFFLSQVAIDTVHGAILAVPDDPGFYYILCRRIGLDGPEVPVALRLGTTGQLVDPHPPTNTTALVVYLAKKVPLDQPLDSDRDGMHDVYELLHPSILDPLDARDASEDADADGVRNLAEFEAGTDPATPDAPTSPSVNFPGLVAPSYPGGQLIDVNNDGRPDSVSRLAIALANDGGTFQSLTQSFIPGVTIVSDARPVNLDGDAYPDMVAVGVLTNRLFTLRGNGDGTFSVSGDYPALNGPSQLALGQLDGNSPTDVALLSVNGRGADLYLNAGDGTLTPFATVTTNAYGTARSFALADLNADGRDDLIIGYAANVVVFLNLTNRFAPAQAYPSGSSPGAIATADLNQDGYRDVIAANSSSGDLSIFFGTGQGALAPQIRLPVGANVGNLWTANLNGDAYPDLLVARANTDFQTLFLNRGDGTFALPALVPIGVGFIGLYDWNGDGHLDLVSSLASLGGLINFGRGDGTFETRLQIVPTNNPPTQVRPLDLNGDQRPELVGINSTTRTVDLWEHQASNPATTTNRLLASLPVGPVATTWTHGDFNGDGRVDLAIATQTNRFSAGTSNQIVLYTNAGNYRFADAGHYPLDLNPSLLVAGDFNQDGRLDLASHLGGGTLAGGSQLLALLGDGSGGFTVGTPTRIGDTLSFLAATDVDRDNRAELVARGSRTSGGLSVGFLEVYAYDSAASTWTQRQSLASTNNIGSQQLIDWNGDSYPDLVVGETENLTGIRSLRFYAGSALGFSPAQLIENNTELSGFSQLADLNADGQIDLLGVSTYYLGKAGGGFHPAQPFWGGNSGTPYVTDFNGDGKPDVVNGLSVLLQR